MKTNICKAGLISALAISSLTISMPVLADNNLHSPDIVVTGTRVAQTLEDSLSPVTIVTREEIEEKQPADIQDLIRDVPGISLINSGGMGKSSSISLRGSETNHVLVLIDGVRTGSATTGSVSIQHIPLEQIERIEVVRGPRSHLYGSSAIGGVVQIFTKRGSKELQHYGSIGYGSHNTMDASTGLTGSAGKTQFAINLGARRSDGFNSCGDGETKPSTGCRVIETDKDGYKQKSFSASISREFSNGLELELQGQAANDKTEFDGSSQNEGKDKQRLLGLDASKDINDIWSVKIATARSWDLSSNYLNGAFSSRFDTVRDSISWQNDIKINETDLFVAGADYANDKVDSTTSYAESERFNRAVFGQYIAEYGDHNAQLSLRVDENQQFGGAVTGSAAWGYAIRPDLEVLASYGTAYNAPTFNELYFPNFGSDTNTPEESRSFEVGLKGTQSRGKWAVYGFQTDVSDLIAFDSDTYLAANIDSARMRGVEAEGSLTWAEWNIDTSASYIEAKNRSTGSNRDNMLIRRPKWRGNINLNRQIDKFKVGASLHYVGVSFDNASNSRKIDHYKTVDLRGTYDIKQNWSVELSANNLFDESYQTSSFFNQDGRNYFLRLRYVPDAE